MKLWRDLSPALVKTSVLSTLLASALVLPALDASAQTVPFRDGFEEGLDPQWERELCCSHSGNIVSNPLGTGKAFKFTLNRTDPSIHGNKRSELKLPAVQPDGSYTYRFSIYLHPAYATDPSMEIVAQWHERPDVELGEQFRTPPLYLKTHNGRWELSRRWDSRRLTPGNSPEGSETIDLGPYERGVYTRWAFKVKWSYGSDGVITILKNGQPVKHITGPNTYNDESGNYFKMGLYKPDWGNRPEESTTTQRNIYFDDIRVEEGF